VRLRHSASRLAPALTLPGDAAAPHQGYGPRLTRDPGQVSSGFRSSGRSERCEPASMDFSSQPPTSRDLLRCSCGAGVGIGTGVDRAAAAVARTGDASHRLTYPTSPRRPRPTSSLPGSGPRGNGEPFLASRWTLWVRLAPTMGVLALVGTRRGLIPLGDDDREGGRSGSRVLRRRRGASLGRPRARRRRLRGHEPFCVWPNGPAFEGRRQNVEPVAAGPLGRRVRVDGEPHLACRAGAAMGAWDLYLEGES
jgi:hypothetical protein